MNTASKEKIEVNHISMKMVISDIIRVNVIIFLVIYLLLMFTFMILTLLNIVPLESNKFDMWFDLRVFFSNLLGFLVTFAPSIIILFYISAKRTKIYHNGHPFQNRPILTFNNQLNTFSEETFPSEGVDLEVSQTIPQYWVGKKISLIIFFPSVISFETTFLYKLLGACKIEMPKNTENQLVRYPLTKNRGNLYVKFNVVSKINYWSKLTILYTLILILAIIWSSLSIAIRNFM